MATREKLQTKTQGLKRGNAPKTSASDKLKRIRHAEMAQNRRCPKALPGYVKFDDEE